MKRFASLMLALIIALLPLAAFATAPGTPASVPENLNID